jgi:3-oxoacyl-[acyl-carrier protein] reductase
VSAPDRVAVVAGVTGGLGRAVASVLKRDGFFVIGTSRTAGDPETCGAVQADRCFSCDLTSYSQVSELVRKIEHDHRVVDALVNCAGIVRSTPIDALAPADIDAVLDTNLKATILLCGGLVRLMRPARHASIVNISSTLARRPVKGTSVYAAAKGGIEAFSRSLALDCAEWGIRVNVIQPALVRTAIWEKAGMTTAEFAEFAQARAASYPLGRIGEPSDVAEAAAFLISEQGSWITGVSLPVDGGAAL